MKKNMLIRILSVVCVLACLFAFASCHDDLATKEEVGNVENNAKTSLEEAKTALNAAIDAVKNTADAAATKAALEEVSALLNTVKGTADAAATKTALDEAIATLNEVKAVAEAAATKTALDEAVASLTELQTAAATKVELEAALTEVNAKIENAGTAATEADTALKTELEGNIAELDTKIADGIGANLTTLTEKVAQFEETVNGQIEEINTAIKQLKEDLALVNGDEGAVAGITERLTALENTVKGINVNAFKDEYLAVNAILLDSTNPKSFASFLSKVNAKIDFGGYDDESVITYERRVDEIKFALSRAVTLEDIDKAFADLVEAEKGLVLLKDSLASQLEKITVINLSEECTNKIKVLKETYNKIVTKNNKVTEKGEGELIVLDQAVINDYNNKTGAYDKLVEYKAEAVKGIDEKLADILSLQKVVLGTDDNTIAVAQAKIAELVNAIKTSQYFDLYTNDVYNTILDAVKVELEAEFKTNNKASYEAQEIADYKAAKYAAKYDELILAGKTEDEAKAEAEAYANSEAAANNAEILASAEEKLNAAAATHVNNNAENVAKTKAATGIVDTLYMKKEATGIFKRFALLTQAMVDAKADGVNAETGVVIPSLWKEIDGIATLWSTKDYPLWDNAKIDEVLAAYNAWKANANYKDDADYGSFTACTADIEQENCDYVLGKTSLEYTGFYKEYVVAMKKVYEDNKVVELIASIKAVVNGDVDVDVDDIDTLLDAIADLDADILVAYAPYSNSDVKNATYMVNAELRERLAIINKAYDDVVKALDELKTKIKYENGEWIIENINAGTDISNFKTAIDAIYAVVAADSTDDNKITSVKSTLAEKELKAANTAFEKFAEKAIDAYIKADETINAIDAAVLANGKLTLDLGDDIYDAITGIQNAIMAQIKGLNLNTYFNIPVYDDDGNIDHYDYVQFRSHYDRLLAYEAEYRALAASNTNGDGAEDVAAKLTALIVAIKDLKADKLDNYNTIVALMEQFEAEWVDVYFVGMSAKEAVAATNAVNKVGAGTYAFVTNATYKILEDLYNTAVKTYGDAEKAAAAWIEKAQALYTNGYTFHDWAKDGGFEDVEEEYKALVALYYITLDANTDPGFGLFAEHENNFKGHHDACKLMAEEATGKITEIVNAIKALNKIEDVTDYAAERTAIDAVKALIDAFQAGYCADAATDGDFVIDDVDYIFVLAKVEAYVKLYEDASALIGTTGLSGTTITEDDVVGFMNMSITMLNGANVVDVEAVENAYHTQRSYFFAD